MIYIFFRINPLSLVNIAVVVSKEIQGMCTVRVKKSYSGVVRSYMYGVDTMASLGLVEDYFFHKYRVPFYTVYGVI